MTLENLTTAKDETERFLRILSALEDRARNLVTDDGEQIPAIKEVGAVRRASLDLTQMLADLRRKPSMTARRNETGHDSITEERRFRGRMGA